MDFIRHLHTADEIAAANVDINRIVAARRMDMAFVIRDAADHIAADGRQAIAAMDMPANLFQAAGQDASAGEDPVLGIARIVMDMERRFFDIANQGVPDGDVARIVMLVHLFLDEAAGQDPPGIAVAVRIMYVGRPLLHPAHQPGRNGLDLLQAAGVRHALVAGRVMRVRRNLVQAADIGRYGLVAAFAVGIMPAARRVAGGRMQVRLQLLQRADQGAVRIVAPIDVRMYHVIGAAAVERAGKRPGVAGLDMLVIRIAAIPQYVVPVFV